MKRLSLLTSALLLSLAATPALANGAERLPKPAVDAYALAPQATLTVPTLLPVASTGRSILPASLPNAGLGTLAGSPEPQLKMASIGGVLGTGSTLQSTADRQTGHGDSLGEGLPSTPVALAAMLLMICILVGRRNRPDRI